MRAVTIYTPNTPATVEERPTPEPGAGEVRVRVSAAAVNPADISMASGLLPHGSVPFTPGMDAAGHVDALGPGVERLTVGDAVMAAVNPRNGGAQAEQIIVPAASAVPAPEGIELTAAATLPMNGLTALEGLRLLALNPGDTLAVTGGAGHLASFVIALARRQGLTVIADAKPADGSRVIAAGADHVIERGPEFTHQLRALVPDGVDAVFDTALLTRSVLGGIRDGGAIAVVRGWDDGGEPERGIRAVPVSVGVALQNTEWLELIAAEAAAGRLTPQVAGTLPAERAQEAYDRMNAGGLRGRIVLTF